MEQLVGGDLLTLFTWRRFCSLPVGQNIRILEFFGSDLHLDFCTRGCPTPWLPLTEPQARFFFLPFSAVPLQDTQLWIQPLNVLCHTYHSRVRLSLKTTLPRCISLTNVKRRRKRHRASFGSYSSCCMWNSMWSTQSGFHPPRPTLAEIQWTGSRPVTFNSLCRFYALPPVWPICSPEKPLDVRAKAALNLIIRP